MALIDGCMHKTAKQIITGRLEAGIRDLDPNAKNQIKIQVYETLIAEIDALPECGAEVTKKKVKKARKLSEYNIHMSNCMKEERKDFGSCVENWNTKKKGGS